MTGKHPTNILSDNSISKSMLSFFINFCLLIVLVTLPLWICSLKQQHLKLNSFMNKNMTEKTILSWSGGKDSTLALNELQIARTR